MSSKRMFKVFLRFVYYNLLKSKGLKEKGEPYEKKPKEALDEASFNFIILNGSNHGYYCIITLLVKQVTTD